MTEILGTTLHYGTIVVRVEPTDVVDVLGKTWRVDEYLAESDGRFAYPSGILVKKDGTLGNVRSKTIRAGVPVEVRQAISDYVVGREQT